MKPEQAIEILDAHAEDFDADLRAEAEQVAAADPDIAEELDRRRMADFRIRSALDAIVPPQSLKADCLRIFEQQHVADVVPTTVAARSIFFRPWMYAAAAAIVIFLLLQPPQSDVSGTDGLSSTASASLSQAGIGPILNDISRQLGNFGSYHHQPPTISAALDFFAAQDAPVSDVLTRHFGHVVPDGCRVLDIKGYRVSMICLQTEPFMHLFIAPKEAAGDEALVSPVESQLENAAFLAWTDGDHLLILATRSGSCEDLKQHAAFAASF